MATEESTTVPATKSIYVVPPSLNVTFPPSASSTISSGASIVNNALSASFKST